MLGVSAAGEGSQRGTAVVFRMRGQMQFKDEKQTDLFLTGGSSHKERIEPT